MPAAKGVTFIPTLMKATPFTTLRLLNRLEAQLAASGVSGQGANMIGVEDSAGNFTGSDLETVLGELYTAATSAGSDSIDDNNNYYATDTVNGAFDALGVQIGGLTDTTFTFTEANVVVNNEAVYASLDKLDLKWGDLASTANAEGASLVGVEDTAGYYTATNVEDALAEVWVEATTAGTDTFTDTAVFYDTDTVNAAFAQLATYIATLSSSALTIATGSVTVSQTYHNIDTEAAAASDDLEEIVATKPGFYVLHLADNTHNVVLKSNLNNIFCPYGFDITLDDLTDYVVVWHNGTNAYVVGMNLASESGGGLGKALFSTAASKGASLVGVQNAASYWSGGFVETVLTEIGTQIGGLTSTTFTFTEANVVVNNEAVYASLDKLDLKWGDLASTANAEGASLVGIEDSGGIITATTVEGALAENRTAIDLNTTHRGSDGSDHTFIDQSVVSGASPTFDSTSFTGPGGQFTISDTNTYYTTDTVDGALDALATQVGGLTDTTFTFTEANVVVNNDDVYTAIDKLDQKWGDLSSTANAEGASLVSIEDSGGIITATTVEDALAENRGEINTLIVEETDDTLQAKRVARAVWDHGVGLAVGTYTFGPTLPDNAVVTRAWYQVVTGFTSGTSTATIGLGIDTDDSGGILAPAVITSVGTAGNHEGIQDGTVANFAVQTTAARLFEGTVAVEATTAGKLILFAEYVVTE